MLLSLGYCALKIRDYKAALHMFEGARKMGASGSEALEGMAEALFALGRYEEAADTAVKLDGHDAFLLAGRSMHRLRRDAEAEAYFKRAYDAEPERPDAAFELAKLRLDRGDAESGVAWAKRALNAEPGSWDAKKLYERALAETRKGKGAPGQWTPR